MSALGYFYGEIPEEKLMLDANEAAARLSVSRTYTSDTVAHCEKVLRAVIREFFLRCRTQPRRSSISDSAGYTAAICTKISADAAKRSYSP